MKKVSDVIDKHMDAMFKELRRLSTSSDPVGFVICIPMMNTQKAHCAFRLRTDIVSVGSEPEYLDDIDSGRARLS